MTLLRRVLFVMVEIAVVGLCFAGLALVGLVLK